MSKKTLNHVDIFVLVEEVANEKNKNRVKKFLYNLITHQSEENPTQERVFGKDYDRIFKNNYEK